uniref:DUF4515 domain-containing protein n=1 Tax=Falco tinnunculus TaxID=100819 RepID=A0A8C4UDF2_FALTI
MASKTKQMKQDTTDMEILVKERKLYLQKEYKILTEHMNTYTGRLDHFLQENKFLEKEVQRNQEENKAYLSYIRKHNQKCQNLIITLNDQNHTDLSQVRMQKEKLISEYTEKEKEVRSSLMNVETNMRHTVQMPKPTALTACSDASINVKNKKTHYFTPHSCQYISRHSWTVSCCHYKLGNRVYRSKCSVGGNSYRSCSACNSDNRS